MKVRKRERGVRVRIHTGAPLPPLTVAEPPRKSSTTPPRPSAAPKRTPVPVQEPTGKFRLTPPAKPMARRARKPSRWAPLGRWLWQNAEPLGWATVLSALALSLWFSPRTQITRVQVFGVPPQAHRAVESLIRSHWRTPLALSDAPRQLERTLLALDWVQAAHWRAAGIGQVAVYVQPRTPFIAVEDAQGTRLFLDPAGLAFAPPNFNESPSAGVIRLSDGYQLPPRGALVEGEMRKAFTILQALHSRRAVMQPRVQLSRTHGIRLWLRVERGSETVPLQVRFGDARALPTQLATLSRILELPTDALRRWAYIDISTPHAEAAKPHHSGGEPL